METTKKQLAQTQRQQSNPVHQMKIYEEYVRKEAHYSNRNKTNEYTINPFNMHNIAEKPNHITPLNPYKQVKTDTLNDDIVDRAFRLDAMRRKIQSAGLQPRQKYPHAMTTNQEIGWYSNPLVPQSKNWQFNRKKSHITGFADEYFTLKKINPFTVKER